MKFINKFLHFVGHTHIHTNKNYLFRTSIHQAFSIGTCQFWSKNDEIWVIRARANGVYKFSEVFQTNKFLTTTIEWTTEVPGWNTEKMSLKNKQKTLLRFLIFWLTLYVIWIVSCMIFGIATFVPVQICCHDRGNTSHALFIYFDFNLFGFLKKGISRNSVQLNISFCSFIILSLLSILK